MAADPRVHVGVAAFIEDEDARIAMLRRADDASHGAGKWSLPGGWVDFGETPAEAAIREAAEEVGLVCEDPVFLGYVTNTYPLEDFHVICLFFRLRLIDGALCNMEPHKHTAVSWMPERVFPQMRTDEILFDPLADYLAGRRSN